MTYSVWNGSKWDISNIIFGQPLTGIWIHVVQVYDGLVLSTVVPTTTHGQCQGCSTGGSFLFKNNRIFSTVEPLIHLWSIVALVGCSVF